MGGRGVKTGSATPPSIGHGTRWRGDIGFGDKGAGAAPVWWSRAPDPREGGDRPRAPGSGSGSRTLALRQGGGGDRPGGFGVSVRDRAGGLRARPSARDSPRTPRTVPRGWGGLQARPSAKDALPHPLGQVSCVDFRRAGIKFRRAIVRTDLRAGGAGTELISKEAKNIINDQGTRGTRGVLRVLEFPVCHSAGQLGHGRAGVPGGRRACRVVRASVGGGAAAGAARG